MRSVTFIGLDETVASGRYRTAMPSRWLYENGVQPGDELLIVGKHAWPHDFTEGYDRYIFDICDDHFKGEWRDHYLHHCDNASALTCNSEVMSEIIHYETGRNAFVIPDPVEGIRQEPHIGSELLWFGHKSNIKTLKRLLPTLKNYTMRVVSDYDNPAVIPYSEKSIAEAFESSGLVVIPVNIDKPAKSANRLIRAVQAGLFVVAEPHPSHEEFSRFMWVGDIPQGVEWALENADKALDKIAECQDFVNSKYSIDKIGSLWKSVIERVSNGTH